MYKKIVLIVLFFTIFLSTSPLSTASSTATLQVDPPLITGLQVGDTFTINITVTSVVDLYGWQFALYYKSSVLNGTELHEGPFLKKDGASTFFYKVNFTDNYDPENQLGQVLLAASRLAPAVTGVDGSGTLATISFKIVAEGESILDLPTPHTPPSADDETKLVDSADPIGTLIPHTTIDGKVSIGNHNIGILTTTLSKTIVGQGHALLINVTAQNLGNYTENFNLTVYHNATAITTQNITLAPGHSTIVTFTWNTTEAAYGNYNITAYAQPVPHETNTDDNNHNCGEVKVVIPGDVNGDKKVDIYDVVKICAAYGSNKGDPNYDPNPDINGDGKIDIYDVVIACSHYGQEQS